MYHEITVRAGWALAELGGRQSAQVVRPAAHQSPLREIVDSKSVDRHEVAGSQYQATRHDLLAQVQRSERHGNVHVVGVTKSSSVETKNKTQLARTAWCTEHRACLYGSCGLLRALGQPWEAWGSDSPGISVAHDCER